MSLTSYQTAPPRVLKSAVSCALGVKANANSQIARVGCVRCGRTAHVSSMCGNARAKRIRSAKILVGTASWSDPGFVERWYPKGMPAAERLAWYAEHFEMVEVNSTFYSVPGSADGGTLVPQHAGRFHFRREAAPVAFAPLDEREIAAAAICRGARQMDAKGKVKLTPEIEEAMIEEISARPIEPLRDSGQAGRAALAIVAGLFAAEARVGRIATTARRARGLPGRDRIAESKLGGRRATGGDAGVSARARGDALSRWMRRRKSISRSCRPIWMKSRIRELAYLRLHGRDAHAYTTGKTVAARFNYDYSDEEIVGSGGAREEAREGSEGSARRLQQQRARLRAARGARALRAALRQIATPPPRQAELIRQTMSDAEEAQPELKR